MFLQIRGQDGHLGCPIGKKNANLVGDIEYLLPVKFRQNLSGSFWEEVEYMKSGRQMDDENRMIIQ